MSLTITPGPKVLNLYFTTPTGRIYVDDDANTPLSTQVEESLTARDDLLDLKVWVSTVSGFTPDNTNLKYDKLFQSNLVLSDLLPGTTYYIKYAYISKIDPDSYTISSQVSATTDTDVSLLTLDTTDWAFIFEDSTATTANYPASITFTANKQNITGTPIFTATAYNSSNTSLGSVTLTGTGDNRVLTSANFNSLGATTVRYVKVVATLGTLSDTVTIWRGDNGSNALTFILTNEAHTVPADSSGNVTSYTGAITYGAIFRGITNETSLWTITKTDGTGLATTLTGTGTNNITLTVNTLDTATDSAVSTITATRTGYPTLTKDFSISKSKAGNPGNPGLGGIQSITAYRVRNQTDAALTTAPSNTTGAVAPTNYSLTASSVTVGQVLWYTFGRYNPNQTNAVDGIPSNTTVWSVPIAASIFQDIKSDNWNGDSPPTSGNFGTGANAGYYLNKTEGSIYVQQAYVKGTLQAGSFIIGTVKLDNSSGRTLQQIESQAFNAVTTAAFDTTLQTKLTSGVTNILAGQNSNYQLFVAPSGSDKIVACHKDVLTADFSQSTWPISAANTTGVPRTYLFIGPGGIFMGKYADTANATKNHRISIDANGDATFAGTVTATAGSFGGINIDTAKIYTGTGTWGNANTGFYADSAGQFSLKDKLTWNGTTLTIAGSITATSTIDGTAASTIKSGAASGATALQNNDTNKSLGLTGGSIGGATIASTKIYIGTGTWGNANTGFYVDSTGQFSLKDKLTWDGTTLNITGSITATSTIDGTTASTIKSGAASGATALQNNDTNKSLGLTGGSIGGATIASTKIYIGTGTWGNANTGFYVDSTGQFSLKDKLTWDGTTLNITGSITATSTIDGTTASTIKSGAASGATALQNNDTNKSLGLTGGSIGGATIASTKIYIGTGTWANTNTGFYVDSTGQFSLKDKLTWDGTTLNITGAITATSLTLSGITIPASNISGLAAVATSGSKTDVGLGNVSNLTPQNQAKTGIEAAITITSGGIAMSSGGYVKGGQTDYNTGTGFFLGYSTDNYKFSIGNPSGQRVTWDGSTFTIVGTIDTTSTIAGTSAGTVVSNAAGALQASSFNTTLQNRLNTGVDNIIAGQGADYRLYVETTSNKIVLGHKDVITAYPNAITNAGVAGVARTYLAITSSGILMGYYGTGANATKTDSISINGATGNATFIGTVTATAGSFGGINIDTAKIYTGTGTWGNANTGFYADSAGQFSLKDKLTWNGTTLNITGAITATSLTLSGGVTVPAASVSGLATVATTGAAANISGLAAVATSGNKADVALGNVSNLTPQNQAKTGIEAAITITSGGIAMSSGGYVKGGQTDYNTGTGFFLGYSTDNYKFSIGNSGGQKLTWDGTNLSITGAITATSLTLSGGVTVPAASVSGLATVATTGAAANISGLAAVATSGNKADVALGNVSNLTPQNQAQTGIEAAITITSGGIAMSSGGYVKGGQTAYNTGTGFFLGYSTDNYKFSIGNPSGQRVTWDGSTFTIVGTIDTTSTIAGTNAGTVVSNAATGASAATTVATKLNKNASDTLTGAINVTTSGGFVAGTLTWDATGTRTGGYGIAMTAKGLVGFDSSGNSTFNISATDGSATFKGAIASGSTISGATVVGGTIQTATSGQRLDINNSGNFTIGSSTISGLGKIVVLNSSNSVLATFGGTGTNTTNSTGYTTADPLLSMYVPALTTTAVYFAQSMVIPAPTYAIPSNPFSGTIGIQTYKTGVGALDKGKQVVNIGRYTNDGNNNEGLYVLANGYNSPLTCNVIAEIGSVYRISATEEYCLGADFWTTDGNSSATEKRVQICKSSSDGSGSGGAAINILKGAFIHNGVTIATPPNNTTTYLRGDGTWQSFLGTIAANYVKNGSVASNAIEVRWSGTKAQLYIDNTYISNGFEASSTGGIANAYANITDGTTTAAASASDTFKFRAGTGLSVVVGSNDATHGDNVLITNTGVTSLTGTSNQVTVSASTGVVTLSLPQSISTSSNVQFNRLGVGIAQQGVDGRIDASNDIVSYSSSDRNLKTNIQPVTDPINKLFKLSGNTFTWKPELEHLHGYSGNDLGVIAQEVEDIFPEAVRTNTNGYKSVRYEKLIPLLIEAIKAQQEQIDKLIKLVEGK